MASLAALYGVIATGAIRAGEPTAGEQIYSEQCARCHGSAGEGTAAHYPEALVGDNSIPQLARIIQETMPEDQDTKCTPEDAEKVAAYIYHAFYSEDARLRNKPARIELTRLTIRQHQSALADIVGSFRSPPSQGSEQGLRGKYFSARGFNPKELKIERVDPEIRFDWGESSPDAEKLESQRFSVLWEGSVIAPDTGEYELVVRCEHAVRLYINDGQKPLIDAWVQSGDDSEHRGEVFLLGGRAYPVKLEFSRAKQGVNDQDKAKQQQFRPGVKNSVSLEWKRPHHTLEVIPARYLRVAKSPRVFVLATPFPPDDRSLGYERGTAISKAWDDATTAAALETAEYVAEHLKELSGVNPEDLGHEPILRRFAMQFVEQAFRSPLSDADQKFYVQRQFESTPDLVTGVKRVVLLSLKSPRFLYHKASGDAADPFGLASRMSFAMWDSVPDRALWKAATCGELVNREQVIRQLQRMLPDFRTRAKLRDFLLYWLRISQPRELVKDRELYPEFTADVASDLRTSMELSIEELLDSERMNFQQFLLSDVFWLNGRLGEVFGARLPQDAPFQKVEFEADRRAGILSHPYLLANLAYSATTSPIHRGVFVSRSVLGRTLRPPPEAVSPLPPDAHSDLSTRERVILQTKPEACQGCHTLINPLGFTMEHFDAIGRFRKREHNRPIDASGSYLTQKGEIEKFRGIEDLVEYVAASEESQQAFVRQLFHHTVKQPILAYGPTQPADLHQAFVRSGFDIRQLLVEIVANSVLLGRSDTTADAH